MSIFRRPSGAQAAGDAIPAMIGGEAHLFCGSSPSGTYEYPERVRTTWYHTTTSDFVNWTEHGPTLAPGPRGSVDGSGVWTGSVVEHDGVHYLFYTGFNEPADNPQTICLATSRDLVHFEKSELNPLLAPIAGYEPVDWRDPFVFYNEDEEIWWMVFSARLAEGPYWRRGCVMFATSEDLLHWEVNPEPLYVPGTTYCPECPELWKADGRWYLIFSRFSEEVGTIYRVADSCRGLFRVPDDDYLGGRRWYAAKSLGLPDGSRAFFGWVHDREMLQGRPRWLWGGDFTAVRRVSPRADGSLQVELMPSVRASFDRTLDERTVRIGQAGSSEHRQVVDRLPDTCLIDCRLSYEEQPASAGVFLAEDDLLAGWYITVDRRLSQVTLAREPRPLDDFWADLTHREGDERGVDGPVLAAAMLPPGIEGNIDISVLLGGEILEVYVNDAVALTHRLSPRGDLRLGAFAIDGTVDASFTLRAQAE